MGFLTTEELNYRQVRQAEIFIEYYFKIQYIKGTKNVRVDALNKKAELQNNKKVLGAILYKDKDKLIRYNYLKLVSITKNGLGRIYKVLESNWLQKI